MIYEDGKSYKLTKDPKYCGWYYRRYIDEPLPNAVLIYRDNDPEMSQAIGIKGDWGKGDSPEPIPLKGQFELFDNDILFFVSDEKEAAKLESSTQIQISKSHLKTATSIFAQNPMQVSITEKD